MSNLDDKLKEIEKRIFYKGASKGLDYPNVAKPELDWLNVMAGEIKQAFKKFGYVSPEESLQTLIDSKGMLSGQEWYDKFIELLSENMVNGNFTYGDVEYAARGAARLDTKQ